MILTFDPNFQRDIQVPIKFHHFPLPENARLPAKSDEDPQNTMGADLSLGKLNFSKQKKTCGIKHMDLLVKFGVGKKVPHSFPKGGFHGDFHRIQSTKKITRRVRLEVMLTTVSKLVYFTYLWDLQLRRSVINCYQITNYHGHPRNAATKNPKSC